MVGGVVGLVASIRLLWSGEAVVSVRSNEVFGNAGQCPRLLLTRRLVWAPPFIPYELIFHS